jgi:ATP-dependent Clp protease ATP-binding subunit ClpA
VAILQQQVCEQSPRRCPCSSCLTCGVVSCEHQMSAATEKLRSLDLNITVTLDESAARYLLSVGYDPLNGARPLRRLISRIIVTQLSKLLLFGHIQPNMVRRSLDMLAV